MSVLTLVAFFVTTVVPASLAQELLNLPAPGVRVDLSPEFHPAVLKGIKIDPANPFHFDFLLDPGESKLSSSALKEESTKLMKYFLASLAVPEKNLWVNLSPLEGNHIIAESFGQTAMGRDLLAQDYLLKQITASLIYPENETGKIFWQKVYQKAQEKYHTTDIPIDTFNKVWVVPEHSVIYENESGALIGEAKLKVMLEQDYLLLSHSDPAGDVTESKENQQTTSAFSSDIVREVVIPLLEEEVNHGRNFIQLRQVYHALLLATWYKEKLKSSIVNQVYGDREKINGIKIDDSAMAQKIYERYLEAYKKGVFNYIKEEQDAATSELVPHKYFSGGYNFGDVRKTMTRRPMTAAFQAAILGTLLTVSALFVNSAQAASNQGAAPAAQMPDIAVERSLSALETQQLNMALVKLDSKDDITRLEGVEILGGQNYSGITLAINGLKRAAADSNPAVRTAAARGLGATAQGDQPSIEVVLNLLNDPNNSVRYFSIQSLGQMVIGDDDHTRIINEILKNAGNEELRYVVAKTVEKIGQGNQAALIGLAKMTADERNIYTLGDILFNFDMADLDNTQAMKIIYDEFVKHEKKFAYQLSFVGALGNIGAKNPLTVTMLVEMLNIFISNNMNFEGVINELARYEYPDEASKKMALDALKSAADAVGMSVYREHAVPALARAIEALSDSQPNGYQTEIEPVKLTAQPVDNLEGLINAKVKDLREAGHFLDVFWEGEGFGAFQVGTSGVYALGHTSLSGQSQSMDRLAVFVEHPDYYGQILSSSAMSIAVEKRGRAYMFNGIYDGHDYRAEDIARFFNYALKHNIALSSVEKKFRDGIIKLGLIRYEPEKVGKEKPEEGPYFADKEKVLITFTLDRDAGTIRKVLNHEIWSHALYFTNADYRKEVDDIYGRLTEGQKKFVKTFLTLQGYHVEDEDDLKAEFAAYFQDPQTLVDILDHKFAQGGDSLDRKIRKASQIIRELYKSDGESFALHGQAAAQLGQRALQFLDATGKTLGKLSHDFQTGDYYAKNLSGSYTNSVDRPLIVSPVAEVKLPEAEPQTDLKSHPEDYVDHGSGGISVFTMRGTRTETIDTQGMISSTDIMLSDSATKRRLSTAIQKSGIQGKFQIIRWGQQSFIMEYDDVNQKWPMAEKDLEKFSDDELVAWARAGRPGREIVMFKNGQKVEYDSDPGFVKKFEEKREAARKQYEEEEKARERARFPADAQPMTINPDLEKNADETFQFFTKDEVKAFSPEKLSFGRKIAGGPMTFAGLFGITRESWVAPLEKLLNEFHASKDFSKNDRGQKEQAIQWKVLEDAWDGSGDIADSNHRMQHVFLKYLLDMGALTQKQLDDFMSGFKDAKPELPEVEIRNVFKEIKKSKESAQLTPGGIDLRETQKSAVMISEVGINCSLLPSHPSCFQFDFTPEEVNQLMSTIDGLTPVIVDIAPAADPAQFFNVPSAALNGPQGGNQNSSF